MLKFASVALCALALVSCGSSEAASADKAYQSVVSSSSLDRCISRSFRDGEVVRLCSELNEEAVAFIKRTVDEKTKELHITSLGGPIPNVIEIADHLRQFDIQLVVRDICLSACGNFIFLSSTRVHVEPQSIVALNQTSTSLLYLTERHDWPDGDRFLSETKARDFAAEEASFFNRSGIDARWLMEGYVRRQHICAVKEIGWDTQPTPTIYTLRRYGRWVPALDLIKSETDVKVSGYWPRVIEGEEKEDLSWIGQLSRKYKFTDNTSIGGTPAFLDHVYEDQLKKLRFCTDADYKLIDK